MAIKYGKKKYRQHYALYTIITAILLCAVFLAMVTHFYGNAQNDAYENLHMQTKQIKDDISLQLASYRENLTTMANFAAKLYADGDDYKLMFDSFKVIGLIENIGILTPQNVFITKVGSIDLDGQISFEEEKERGTYISGRLKDLTQDNYELIRGAAPIKVGGETVGILYGVIKLDKLKSRYSTMAKELDAQLFVYDKESGDLIIDTVHNELGNISFLKDRKYNDGYSYEQMENTPNGFTSFMSAYKDENMHLHYSTIDDIGWMIALARYDSQVFASTITLTQTLLLVFFIMLLIIFAYVLTLMQSERRVNAVTTGASDIRKILLETSGNQTHVTEALKQVCYFAKSRSAVFFNTDGDEYDYISPYYHAKRLPEGEKKYLMTVLFRYANEFYNITGTAVNILCIRPNKHLIKTNPDFYQFLKTHKIEDISFSATISGTNNITILAVINAKQGKMARMLAEKISACFSIALHNKNNLDKTQLEATTDGLTGTLNRVAYKADLSKFDEEKTLDFSCLYIDVNELHTINNKFGHAAGDEMLIYIANALKDVFYGHKVYRMGGDEFLVFCKNTEQDIVENSIERLNEHLKPRNYHVAVGLSFRAQNTNAEEMVKEAEVRMYEAKAQYYQNKEKKQVVSALDKEFVQTKTGIIEIDTMLSVIKESYSGIYEVSLNTDKAKAILMPASLGYNENEEHFSVLFSKFVEEAVEPDYHRAINSFVNYEALKKQLLQEKIPKISFARKDGVALTLSVYKLGDVNTNDFETLWVFAKD